MFVRRLILSIVAIQSTFWPNKLKHLRTKYEQKSGIRESKLIKNNELVYVKSRPGDLAVERRATTKLPRVRSPVSAGI